MGILPDPAMLPQTSSQPQHLDQFTRNQRKHYLLSLGIIVLFVFISTGSYYLGTQRNKLSLTGNTSPTLVSQAPTNNTGDDNSPTPITSPTPSIASWKTYRDEDIFFQYPADWEPRQMNFSAGSYTKGRELNTGYAIDNLYSLSVTKNKNFEPGTGKIFTSLDDYLNLKKPGKTVVVDGQLGLQVFPQEDIQNLNKVVFFSRDKKHIYDIQMTIFVRDEKMIAQGQQLFDTILSSFIMNN